MKPRVMPALRAASWSVLLLASLTASADEESRPIVDVRFDGPYGQVESSVGDEWAPTWGPGDVLYTGNNDGTSFGGVPLNTIAFGKLEGSDPYQLKATTINGMQEYKERHLGPEASNWKTLDSYAIEDVFHRFTSCGTVAARAICLETSRDEGKTWARGKPLFHDSRLQQVRFLVWSKQYEVVLGATPSEYVYAASYAGVIDGEDQYIIARVPIARLAQSNATDWVFQQRDYSWGPVEGAVPMAYHGTLGPDGANWKTMNSYSVDGVLYMFVTRCAYPTGSSDPKRRHIFQNSSIIKSADQGRTWTRSPQENYANPMFPGKRFGTAYFVWFGKDGVASVDNADQYVYAVSNNGHFENGDSFVLGRVLRSRLPDLSAADWSFYTKGDGKQPSSWTSSLDAAEPILAQPGRLSMTGMTYIPALHRYVMVTWHYNQANFQAGIKARDLSTVIEFFEAPKPWGPWSKVKSLNTGKLGWFVPVVGQRFQIASGDGTVKAFLYPSGFGTKAEGGLDFDRYKFNYIPITLSTVRLKHKDPAYVGGR